MKLQSELNDTKVHGTPSRLNGENIAGAAFLFFSALFMAAGQVNAVFAVVYPVDYMLAAAGAALVFLGYRTWKNERISMEERIGGNRNVPKRY